MQFNNLTTIIEALQAWDEIRESSTDVVNYLSQGNSFKLKRDSSTAANLHAYPGIGGDDKELYFFIIDAAQDIDSSEMDLFNAITICRVESNVNNGDEIPEIIARKRVENWDKNLSSWVTAQIDRSQQTQGIFKAFNIPSSYAQQNMEYTVYFGLKENPDSLSGYDADLITKETSKASIVYYDTVRPVPPFDVFPQNSFYLLSLV